MNNNEQALRLIFEDVQRGLHQAAGDSVPLSSLIEELGAGFRPTQELFDELVRLLCCGLVELCDDAQYIRLRNAPAGSRLSPDPHLKMGEVAILAAAFARLFTAQAEPAPAALANQLIDGGLRIRATKTRD